MPTDETTVKPTDESTVKPTDKPTDELTEQCSPVCGRARKDTR